DKRAGLTGDIIKGVNLHKSITELAAMFIKDGMSSGGAVNQLRALMMVSAAKRDRPEEWKQRYEYIKRAIDTAQGKYKPPREGEGAYPRAERLEAVITSVNKWLRLKDVTPVYVVLGAVAANLLPGDPVWLGLIAPPSSAKTEILNSVSRLQ